MAKRIIHECDLTKQEFNPDEEQVFILSINKKGRKSPMKYEISSQAAEKLLAQLNGNHKLENNWSFSESQPQRTRQTLEDFDDDQDDASFVANKIADLKEQNVIPEESERQTEAVNTSCRHINKGRIQISMRDGKRFVYRQCNNCSATVEEMTAEARKSYMNGKAPQDIRIKDL